MWRFFNLTLIIKLSKNVINKVINHLLGVIQSIGVSLSIFLYRLLEYFKWSCVGTYIFSLLLRRIIILLDHFYLCVEKIFFLCFIKGFFHLVCGEINSLYLRGGCWEFPPSKMLLTRLKNKLNYVYCINLYTFY